MTHAHITTWLFALILFFIAIALHKKGKVKPLKVVQTILRLFYLLIIITGAMMLFSINIDSIYIVKAALGVLVIAFFELILSRVGKNQSTGMFWGSLIVSFAVVVYLGLRLPL